jgi:hypothetical protein
MFESLNHGGGYLKFLQEMDDLRRQFRATIGQRMAHVVDKLGVDTKSILSRGLSDYGVRRISKPLLISLPDDISGIEFRYAEDAYSGSIRIPHVHTAGIFRVGVFAKGDGPRASEHKREESVRDDDFVTIQRSRGAVSIEQERRRLARTLMGIEIAEEAFYGVDSDDHYKKAMTFLNPQ